MVLCGKQMAKDEERRGGVTPSKATEDTAFYTQVFYFPPKKLTIFLTFVITGKSFNKCRYLLIFNSVISFTI